MRVTELIQMAFERARAVRLPDGYNRQRLHQKRSEAWVQALAHHFQTEYPRERCRVFSKYDDSNRADFGLNELLFDVSVCEVERTNAAKAPTHLLYVSGAVWQVESELEKNSRAAMLDFSKLVLGRAPNKLFIVPLADDPVAFRDALLPVAKCCSGRVFLAVVPHPEDWDREPAPEAFILAGGQWVPCGNQTVQGDGP